MSGQSPDGSSCFSGVVCRAAGLPCFGVRVTCCVPRSRIAGPPVFSQARIPASASFSTSQILG